MIDIFSLVGFSTLFVLNVTLFVLYIRSRIAHKNTAVKFVEVSMMLESVKLRLSEEINKKDVKTLEQTEGFLKFVSDSRDWAFEYIEEVQSALEEFDAKVYPILEWSKTYGIVNGDNAHTEALENISLAYEQLKKVMPENNQTPNN